MKENKYVILTIDDDQDTLESLKLILTTNGYIVEDAFSAESGIKKFKECSPDLIIVDLMMEEVDSGTNCIKELKLLGNEAPIFMLSSLGDQLYSSVDVSSLGLSGVFQKPLDPKTLLRLIKEKLGKNN